LVLLLLFACCAYSDTLFCGALLGTTCPPNGILKTQIQWDLVGPPAPTGRARIILQNGAGLNYDIYVETSALAYCTKRCNPVPTLTTSYEYSLNVSQWEKELWVVSSSDINLAPNWWYISFVLRPDKVSCNIDAYVLLENLVGQVPTCVSQLAQNCYNCTCDQCAGGGVCCPTYCASSCWSGTETVDPINANSDPPYITSAGYPTSPNPTSPQTNAATSKGQTTPTSGNPSNGQTNVNPSNGQTNVNPSNGQNSIPTSNLGSNPANTNPSSTLPGVVGASSLLVASFLLSLILVLVSV